MDGVSLPNNKLAFLVGEDLSHVPVQKLVVLSLCHPAEKGAVRQFLVVIMRVVMVYIQVMHRKVQFLQKTKEVIVRVALHRVFYCLILLFHNYSNCAYAVFTLLIAKKIDTNKDSVK